MEPTSENGGRERGGVFSMDIGIVCVSYICLYMSRDRRIFHSKEVLHGGSTRSYSSLAMRTLCSVLVLSSLISVRLFDSILLSFQNFYIPFFITCDVLFLLHVPLQTISHNNIYFYNTFYIIKNISNFLSA